MDCSTNERLISNIIKVWFHDHEIRNIVKNLLVWVQIGRTAPVLQRGNAGARSVWTSIYTTAHH